MLPKLSIIYTNLLCIFRYFAVSTIKKIFVLLSLQKQHENRLFFVNISNIDKTSFFR